MILKDLIDFSFSSEGGATALTVALGTASFSQGWMYVLLPVLWDCVILVVIALIFDNLSASMLYPKVFEIYIYIY